MDNNNFETMFFMQENVSEANENWKINSTEIFNDTSTWWTILDLLLDIVNVNDHPWALSVFGSILVGLSGILPLLIIPLDYTANKKTETAVKTLRLLLSFAVGGLLGDVFLHLLPQVWIHQYVFSITTIGKEHPPLKCGLWILAGLLVFIIIEKMVRCKTENNTGISEEPTPQNYNSTNNSKTQHQEVIPGNKTIKSWIIYKLSTIHISGYLNLIANSLDNFTNGLAIGGSFMLSTRVGIFTTFAILVHVIPHEVGDFAILLKAGFSRRDAACAQLYTAFAGIIGSVTALVCNANATTLESRTSWILPFTAGGFLHIAMVTVTPELVSEKNAKESFKQIFSLLSGVLVIAILTGLVEDGQH